MNVRATQLRIEKTQAHQSKKISKLIKHFGSLKQKLDDIGK